MIVPDKQVGVFGWKSRIFIELFNDFIWMIWIEQYVLPAWELDDKSPRNVHFPTVLYLVLTADDRGSLPIPPADLV